MSGLGDSRFTRAQDLDGRVRPARDADCKAIASIYNEAIAEGISTMDTVPKSAGEILDWMQGMLLRERLLVIEEADAVQGWGVLKRYSDRQGYRYAAETSVYVTATREGKGLGSALQRALLVAAQELGYAHLVAKILAANGRSVDFHVRHGYEIVGVQKHVGNLDGTWHDIVILQYLLSAGGQPS